MPVRMAYSFIQKAKRLMTFFERKNGGMKMREEQIKRIKEMEQCLDIARSAVDKLSEALAEYVEAHDAIKKLMDYYESGLWRTDFEADEAGELPADLKRGVLSEDAVYDLITDETELRKWIERLKR